jgi:hypothetical protein
MQLTAAMVQNFVQAASAGQEAAKTVASSPCYSVSFYYLGLALATKRIGCY